MRLRSQTFLIDFVCIFCTLGTFFVLTSLPMAAWSLENTRALGELGLQVFSERHEDASGSATSERSFRVDVSAGAESATGEKDNFGYGVSLKTDRGLHSSAENSGYGLGGFLSWRRSAFSVRLERVFFAESKSTSAVTETSYRDGSGWALEVRWLPTWMNADESKSWALGPSLSYQQTTFKKVRVGTLPESSADRTIESISPGLRAVFLF